jgi:hypothetical protein
VYTSTYRAPNDIFCCCTAAPADGGKLKNFAEVVGKQACSALFDGDFSPDLLTSKFAFTLRTTIQVQENCCMQPCGNEEGVIEFLSMWWCRYRFLSGMFKAAE